MGVVVPHRNIGTDRLDPLWRFDRAKGEYFYLGKGTPVYASSVVSDADEQSETSSSLGDDMEVVRDARQDHIDELLKKYQYGQASATFVLRKYQESGINWMLQRDLYGETLVNSHRRHAFGRLFGGFLCDDMGLGETPQALTLIYVTLLRGTNGGILNCDQIMLPPTTLSATSSLSPLITVEKQLPTLIVCPNTATSMWLNKCREYFPITEVDGVAHGMRAQLFSTGSCQDGTDLSGNHIFVSSFEQLLADFKKKKLLQKREWRRVIIDEGHNIRQKKSVRFLALTALRTKGRWSLTGTPVQNKPSEFSSQAEWLQLGKEEQGRILSSDKAKASATEQRDECRSEFLLRRTWAHLRLTNQMVQSDEMPKPIVEWVDAALDDKHRELLIRLHQKILR